MRKKQSILLTLLVVLFLNSCDEYNYVYYIVENQANDSIQIDYSYYTYYSNEESESNSIVINSNTEDTLFTFELISPSVYNKDDGNVLKYLFDVEGRRIIDTTRIKKSILQGKHWEFEKIEDNFANFKITIKDEDF